MVVVAELFLAWEQVWDLEAQMLDLEGQRLALKELVEEVVYEC